MFCFVWVLLHYVGLNDLARAKKKKSTTKEANFCLFICKIGEKNKEETLGVVPTTGLRFGAFFLSLMFVFGLGLFI